MQPIDLHELARLPYGKAHEELRRRGFWDEGRALMHDPSAELWGVTVEAGGNDFRRVEIWARSRDEAEEIAEGLHGGVASAVHASAEPSINW